MPPYMHVCAYCQAPMPSRNKLFQHLEFCQDNPSACRAILDDAEAGDEGGDDGGEDAAFAVPATLEIAARKEGLYRVVVKPQGLPTMGDRGQKSRKDPNNPGGNPAGTGKPWSNSPARSAAQHDSLVISEQSAGSRIARALPCHRLDAPTGGLLVCAESHAAAQGINAAFRTRMVHKRYRAIVAGRLSPPAGSIVSPLGGKECHTDYRTVSVTRSLQYGDVSSVDLSPVTGRTHQLRRHMLELGCPIIGDRRYSHASSWPWAPAPRHLLLWSLEISFPDPGAVHLETLVKGGRAAQVAEKDWVHVQIPEPAVFEDFRRAQEEQYRHHHQQQQQQQQPPCQAGHADTDAASPCPCDGCGRAQA